MNIVLTKQADASRYPAVIYLLRDEKQLKETSLDKNEQAYAKGKLSDKNHQVSVPSINKQVLVYTVKEKTNAAALEKIRKDASGFIKELNGRKADKVAIINLSQVKGSSLAFAEGMALSSYQFLKYKSAKEKQVLKEIAIHDSKVNADEIDRLNIAVKYIFLARDWVNEPQSFLDAEQLARELEKAGKESGVKVEVFNKNRIKALKMGGLLAVNKGSVMPPTFTVMEYKPKKAINKKPIILVGKGVVYDTGGLSLKPTPNSMDYMKCDMAGAAVVGVAICAAAEAKLPLHIITLVPATDNRPGGDAYTPGDVVRMYNGKTVEVLNTDAEGRMILGDALAYAQKFDPMLVMDFATLTGAAAIAIGQYGLVCMGTASEETVQEMKRAGEQVYERLVEFPLWEEYKELIKSDIADMKNIGGPVAGAITAGKFLEEFTNYPWMHFDIAGSAFLHSPDSYRGKGGTGTGIRFLLNYFEQLSAGKL